MTEDVIPYVFLSCAAADVVDVGVPLREYLHARGVDCFLYKQDVGPGVIIPEAIQDALQTFAENPTGYFVVYVSTHAMASRWVRYECSEAQMSRAKKDYDYIIPVLAPGTDPAGLQALVGRSTSYLVERDPLAIGGHVVAVISRKHGLTPRVRYRRRSQLPEWDERELDAWDYGLLDYVATHGKVYFRWWSDTKWGVLLTVNGQQFFQVFKSVISPLIDLAEGGLLERRSGGLLDESDEEFRLTPLGAEVNEAAKRMKVWAWANRLQVQSMRMEPFELVSVVKRDLPWDR